MCQKNQKYEREKREIEEKKRRKKEEIKELRQRWFFLKTTQKETNLQKK